MKHRVWWCVLIYKDDCPVCKVRQLRYAFRLDPIGYKAARDTIAWNTDYTSQERLWILDQVKLIGEGG